MKYDFTQIIEILKASVPIFSIVAVVIAAILNAEFNKRQKERDELLSYKIKSYINLCETIAAIKQDYENLIENVNFNKKINCKNIIEIDTDFKKVLYKNLLFINKQKRYKFYLLSNMIFVSSIKEKINFKAILEKEELLKTYREIIDECDEIIMYLHKDLGFDKLDSKSHKI